MMHNFHNIFILPSLYKLAFVTLIEKSLSLTEIGLAGGGGCIAVVFFFFSRPVGVNII